MVQSPDTTTDQPRQLLSEEGFLPGKVDAILQLLDQVDTTEEYPVSEVELIDQEGKTTIITSVVKIPSAEFELNASDRPILRVIDVHASIGYCALGAQIPALLEALDLPQTVEDMKREPVTLKQVLDECDGFENTVIGSALNRWYRYNLARLEVTDFEINNDGMITTVKLQNSLGSIIYVNVSPKRRGNVEVASTDYTDPRNNKHIEFDSPINEDLESAVAQILRERYPRLI